MNPVVIFEWQFSPPNYFEEPIDVSQHGYMMTSADGKVQAKIDSVLYDADPSIRQRMHKALNDICLAEQLFNHHPYKLSNSTMTRLHPDGRKDLSIEIEGQVGRFDMKGVAAHIQIIDKDGNIVVDTKRDQIEKKQIFTKLITKYHATDSLLDSLLHSNKASVDDPNNELVHLYEILEALETRFRKDVTAQMTLGISKDVWGRMSRLCNESSLRQGRHRGQSGGMLRDATESELTEARDIAQSMIESYLTYLEANAK